MAALVRIAEALPSTATNKVLKRELAAQGTDVPGPVWARGVRDRSDGLIDASLQ